MGFMVGPAPVRRTLRYLQSGALQLKQRVSIIEMHYNMYFKMHRTVPSMSFRQPAMREKETQAMVRDRMLRRMELKEQNQRFERPPDNHTGMREFYFWEVPRLQYQNPDIQMVRFLERSPLPFLRVWLNDGSDVLFDCDYKDRTAILEQLVRTLGIVSSAEDTEALKKSKTRSVTALPMTDPSVGNPATFGFNRDRYCMCEVPDQVPCPGVCQLPMRMRGKYLIQKKEELEAWENDLDRPYPTGPEMEKERVAFPVKHEPAIPNPKGLDQMFMRKPKQQTRPLLLPHQVAERYPANRFEKDSDRKLFDRHKK